MDQLSYIKLPVWCGIHDLTSCHVTHTHLHYTYRTPPNTYHKRAAGMHAPTRGKQDPNKDTLQNCYKLVHISRQQPMHVGSPLPISSSYERNHRAIERTSLHVIINDLGVILCHTPALILCLGIQVVNARFGNIEIE